MKDSLVLDITIQQLMLFQQLLRKLDKLVTQEILLVGVFLDLQKAFDNVNHDMLLKKLEHYGIRGITNSWLQLYLNDRMQFTAVNKCQSSKKYLMHGVPQGSVLGPLLFILFIDNLYKSVEFSSVHRSADDTNLILNDKSMKKINKHIHRDLKFVVQWI